MRLQGAARVIQGSTMLPLYACYYKLSLPTYGHGAFQGALGRTRRSFTTALTWGIPKMTTLLWGLPDSFDAWRKPGVSLENHLTLVGCSSQKSLFTGTSDRSSIPQYNPWMFVHRADTVSLTFIQGNKYFENRAVQCISAQITKITHNLWTPERLEKGGSGD